MFKALITTLIVSIAVLYFTGIVAAITVFLVMGVVTYKGGEWMTNYNPVNETIQRSRGNKHREELLLSLDSKQWETFHGDGRSDNHKESHVITLDPMGLSYLTLLDSEIATNTDISTECKVTLIRFIAFYFDRLNTWAASARGRKRGIFGNLSLGYIMHTQDDKINVQLQLFRMLKEDNIHIFRLDINGSGFESFNGFVFVYDDDRIYHLTDDRVSELQENK